MPLSLRDSLTGQSHAVVPGVSGAVGLYVCGPTVYAAAHVGHGRTYLYFDLVRRLLAATKVPVRHVMNITDVEDKIADRAAALGVGWSTLARREERSFRRDLDALRILRPDQSPRASDYVARMVEVARALEASGRVRRGEEGWVYDAPASHCAINFPSVADLARHAVPEPGQSFSENDGAPGEFLIWKPQSKPRPSFPSPWGAGVPGWHLECYTMARDLLGIPTDLHGGGVDLVYPHHFAENEVALTLDAQPFAKTFLHTSFVTEDGHKMSKSTGNLVALRTELRRLGPDALRWYLLSPPYDRRLDWSDASANAAAEEYSALHAALRRSVAGGAGGAVAPQRFATLVGQIRRDLSDGLRSHDALDRLRAFQAGLAHEANPRVQRGGGPAAKASLREIEALLGLVLT
jgi:cysteinyl-tRNA synthetase